MEMLSKVRTRIPSNGTTTMREESNNANIDVMGENWKSALCVTSLYDSYVALQHENATLLEQVRQLTHTNELLQVEARKKRPERRPEHDVIEEGIDDHTLVKEIQLLRVEKAQQELLFDKRRLQLENELSEYKALYTTQLDKYHQKFSLDPNEPARVALSTQTLQQTLDRVLSEKQEMTIQYNHLQQLYHKLEEEHRKTTAILDAHVLAAGKHRQARALQCVYIFLGKWAHTRMSRAWERWQHMIALDKAQEQAYIRRKEKAASLLLKYMETSTRRMFSTWKYHVQKQKQRRSTLSMRAIDRRITVLRIVFNQWKDRYKMAQAWNGTADRLMQVMERHTKRVTWRTWWTACKHILLTHQEDRTRKITEQLSSVKAQWGETQTQLALALESNQQMRLLQDQHTQAIHVQYIRLEAFLAQQQAQTMRQTLFNKWRIITKDQRRVNNEIARFQRKHWKAVKGRMLLQWRQQVAHIHACRVHTRHFLQRMRFLSVYRCFNAWRDRVFTRKTRLNTLQTVINRFKHQHIHKCFVQWTDFRDERKAQRHQMNVLNRMIEQAHVTKRFEVWKRTVKAMHAAKEQEIRNDLEREWQNRIQEIKKAWIRLRVCWTSWKQMIEQRRRLHKLTNKAIRRVLGTCLHKWKILIQVEHEQREALDRCASRWYHTNLQRAIVEWKRFVLEQRTLFHLQFKDQKLATIQQELEAVRAAEERARHATVSHQQNVLDQTHLYEKELTIACLDRERITFALCKLYKTVQTQRRARELMRTWQKWCVSRHEQRERLSTYLHMRMRCLLQTVFRAWSNPLRKKKQIMQSLNVLTRCWYAHIQQQCLMAFKVHCEQQQRILSVLKGRNRIRTHSLLSRVWKAWHQHVKTRVVLHGLVQCVCTHWSQKCWQQWKENTIKIREEQFKRMKQTALMNFQRQILQRWIDKSLQVVFQSWRRAVHVSKRQRAASIRMGMWDGRRVLALTFNMWKTRVAQSHWLITWEYRLKLQQIAHRWNHWKAIMIAERQQDRNMLRIYQANAEQMQIDQQAELKRLASEVTTHVRQLSDIQCEKEYTEQQVHALKSHIELIKRFHTWRVWLLARRSRKSEIISFTDRVIHRRMQTIWFAWKQMVKDHHNRINHVTRIQDHHNHSVMSRFFYTWRQYQVRLIKVTRTIARIKQQQSQRTKITHFYQWLSFIHFLQQTTRLVTGLEQYLRHSAVHHGFTRWKYEIQQQRLQDIAQKDKQKRILTFLMNKGEYHQTKYFQAWKALTIDHHQRRKQAERRCTDRKHETMYNTWKEWRANVHRYKCYRRHLTRLEVLIAKQRLRIILAWWKQQIGAIKIGTLTTACAVSTTQIHKLNNYVEQQSEKIENLETSIATLHKQIEYHQQSSHSKTLFLKRQVALNTVFMHSCVSHSLVAGFLRWKNKCLHQREHERMLKRCEMLWRRKQRALAFLWWKRTVESEVRQGRLQNRRTLSICRKVWYEWREWIHARVIARRTFLMRWIDATHTRRSLSTLKKQMAASFRMWKYYAHAQGLLIALQETKELCKHEQKRRQTMWRQFLLAKWTWQAYTTRLTSLQRFFRQVGTIPASDKLFKVRGHKRTLREPSSDKLSPLVMDDATITHGIQSLFRRLSTVYSASELFNCISISFPHIIHSCSAVLFLLDPVANELWTITSSRNSLTQPTESDPTIAHVPATLGIAGHTISSLMTLLIEDPLSHNEFHPLVDQYALSGLESSLLHRHRSTGRTRTHSSDHTVSLFSSPIVASDGTVLGVLQAAFTNSFSDANGSLMRAQIQLLGNACCFYVEQLLYDMIRYCRDSIQARTPQNFMKLFKQNKNWRKYFAQIERQARKTEQRLQDMIQEQTFLVEERARQQQTQQEQEKQRQELVTLQAKVERSKQEQEELIRHVSGWKKKMIKLKLLVEEKDHALEEKTNAYNQVIQQMRANEWQNVLSNPSTQRSRRRPENDEQEDGRMISRSLVRDVEYASLKNQLVRSESDNVLLVSAVEVATKHQGMLPEGLEKEVHRISLRVKNKG